MGAFITEKGMAQLARVKIYEFRGYYGPRQHEFCVYKQGIRPTFMTFSRFHSFRILSRELSPTFEFTERDLTRPFRVFQRRVRAWLLWHRRVRRAAMGILRFRPLSGPAATVGHRLERDRP